MPHTTNPTGDDLKDWLRGTGLIKDFTKPAPAALDYDGAVSGALKSWEKATGYTSGFLASESDVPLEYYGREILNRVLVLRTGLVSLTSLSIGDTAQTEGTDFQLAPYSANMSGQPFKRVEFLGYWGLCGASALTVVGKIGYAEEYPDDVWQIILAKAARSLFPQVGLQISGGVASIGVDDIRVQYVRSSGGRDSAGGPLSQERDIIDRDWRALVQQYRF